MNRQLLHRFIKIYLLLCFALGFAQFWIKWKSSPDVSLLNLSAPIIQHDVVTIKNSRKSEIITKGLGLANDHSWPSSTTPSIVYSEFLEAAKRRAVNQTIIMCYFDSSVLDVALNFYETSVARLGLKNVLFVGSSHACCIQLNALDSGTCVVFTGLKANIGSSIANIPIALQTKVDPRNRIRDTDNIVSDTLRKNVVKDSRDSGFKFSLKNAERETRQAKSTQQNIGENVKMIASSLRQVKHVVQVQGDHWEQESLYGSSVFNHKMDVRTELILALLEAGLTVLHTDIDVYFVKNPLEHIKCSPPYCHIATLMDKPDLYNAGFVYVRPTDYGKAVYSKMRLMTTKGFYKFSDQDQLRIAINDLKHRTGFHHVPLPLEQFQSGLRYFEQGFRHFTDDNPCVTCIVVHNNFLVTAVAKVYRARETGLWTYEGEDQYYSSPIRKYLLYDNPHDFGNSTVNRDEELRSLRSALALALILNRTLILPRFHCDSSVWCSFLSHYRLTTFDKYFRGLYREHSFLAHPKVPAHVRQSLSTKYFIATRRAQEISRINGTLKNITIVIPVNRERGAKDKEIIQWFVRHTESVLQFHSLYNAFDQFDDEQSQRLFEERIADALQNAPYKQT